MGSAMSCFRANTDWTEDLPDEVLCRVFSFLTLAEKLRSEAVNFKFQRCVIRELKANPQPLNLDLAEKKLNGFNLPGARELIFGALQTLAEKAKFSSIWVHVESATCHERTEQSNRILSVLTSQNQCLTKVTSFDSNAGCSQAVFENFLDKCDKLSSLKLDFYVRPLRSPLPNIPLCSLCRTFSFPLDLCRLLKNRGLTELKLSPLKLSPSYYPNKDLARVFQEIKPDTLRKLDLSFDTRDLNLVELVKALVPNGSALEEIRLGFRELRMDLSGLFESLAQLPALRKCHIDCVRFDQGAPQQFVPAVTSLLALSHINITVNADRTSLFVNRPGCQIVNMIRQIQNVHPGLVVDFNYGTLILSLGNASIRKSIRFSKTQ